MISTPVSETCVVVAEVTGDSTLVSKLGETEAARARERCLSRAERSIEAHQGQTLKSEGRRLVAVFPRCDTAVLAASDIRDRVAQLPPVSGVSLSVRIGVHCGPNEGETSNPSNEAVEIVNNLASVASPGQILLSGEASMHLPESVRGQIDTQTQLSVSSNGYDLPIFELKSGTAALREATLRSLPAAAPRVEQPAKTAEAAAPRSRLMLRYLNHSFVVSELQPVLLAGREEGNDVVITDRRASRHHARIEWRSGRYVLIDNSTNGTYLVDDSGVEIVLRRGECDLPPRGRVGLGYSPNEVDVDSMMFDIGQR
ncbi:MAG: FHA domain-containing protein [Moraxellaceae bacterium]|nr:FHA domain-containing protein [Moraxellaceae bacterium]